MNGRARRTSVRTEAAKRITVLESPKCLFVHLKRAKYSQQVGQEKITCHVDFPQSLNLGPYMTHADKENNPEYLLRAVVVHHGKQFASGTLNYIYSFEHLLANPGKLIQSFFSKFPVHEPDLF